MFLGAEVIIANAAAVDWKKCHLDVVVYVHTNKNCLVEREVLGNCMLLLGDLYPCTVNGYS